MAIILKEQGVLEYNTGDTLPVIDVIVGTKARNIDTGDKSTWDGTAWVPGWGEGEAPTGLEAVDDGNGIGWRLIGSDPASFGDIGANAVDLSIVGGGTDTDYGATGMNSFAAGEENKAKGEGSVAVGIKNSAAGSDVILGNSNISETGSMPRPAAVGNVMLGLGNGNETKGFSSVAIGVGNKVTSGYGTALGVLNEVIGDGTDGGGASTSTALGAMLKAITVSQLVIGTANVGESLDTSFELGIGATGWYGSTKNRINGLEVYKDGTVVAPELTTALIDGFAANHSVDNTRNSNLAKRVLVTKEYVDANAGPKVTDITWADLVTKADAGELKVWDKFIVTDMSNLPAEIKFIAPDGSCFIEVMDEAYIVELKKIE